jgi:hypothetical protein
MQQVAVGIRRKKIQTLGLIKMCAHKIARKAGGLIGVGVTQVGRPPLGYKSLDEKPTLEP